MVMGNCCGDADQIQDAVTKIVDGIKKIVDGAPCTDDSDVVSYKKVVTTIDFNISDLTLAGLTLIEGLAAALRSAPPDPAVAATHARVRREQFEALRQQTRARRSVSVIDGIDVQVAKKLVDDFVDQTERTGTDGAKTLEPAALANACAQVVRLVPSDELADASVFGERMLRLVHATVPPRHWVQVVNAMSIAVTGVAAPQSGNPQPGAAPTKDAATS